MDYYRKMGIDWPPAKLIKKKVIMKKEIGNFLCPLRFFEIKLNDSCKLTYDLKKHVKREQIIACERVGTRPKKLDEDVEYKLIIEEEVEIDEKIETVLEYAEPPLSNEEIARDDEIEKRLITKRIEDQKIKIIDESIDKYTRDLKKE